MKIVLSWLKEFFPEGSLDTYSTEELAGLLTGLGMVVEEVHRTGAQLDGVVVAKVMALREHPKADKIQLVDIDAGEAISGEGMLQICCGATNMKTGDLVPLATIGTSLPNGLTIAKRKMRGQESNGMLCAADEIGLEGGTDDGLFILDSSFTVGAPLADALGIVQDVVFELDLEGNRPDALSVLGVARDLAAKLGLSLVSPSSQVSDLMETESKVDGASVSVDANGLCARFGFRVLEAVRIGSSPQWMADRLTAAGMRPINSLVDISNYVMLELGTPNHTYDLDLVPDGVLQVRLAKDAEQLVTLDQEERSLVSSDLVIADSSDKVIGLAGVMGGASTEIHDGTSRVLLEAAVWDSMSIAKTSRRLGLRSEASVRFERGVDPKMLERALARFVELAIDICDAKPASLSVVAEQIVFSPPVVDLRLAKVSQYLGVSLASKDIVQILEPLGFLAVEKSGEVLEVTVPSWRPDSSLEVDIIEEIARHYGYEKIEKLVPRPAQSGALTPDQRNRRRLRRMLTGLGLYEALPLPFLAPEDLQKAGFDEKPLALVNPLVADESVLRTSLLPGLLKSVSYNQSHRASEIGFYELGVVFSAENGGAALPKETEQLALISAGFDTDGSAARQAVQWLRQLDSSFSLGSIQVLAEPAAGLHPTRSSIVQFRGKPIGCVGEVSPDVLDAFSVTERVAYLQLEVAPLLAALRTSPKYAVISRFPSSDLDLAFLVPDAVSADSVQATLQKAAGELVLSVHLFDVFRPESSVGERSLAYTLRLQAEDRTLTDTDVADVQSACIQAMKKSYNAPLRS